MSRQIAVKRYARRFRQPLRTARGEWAVREGFIVRVASESGVGFGEVAPISEFGTETVAAAGAFLQQLVAEPDLPVPADLPCCAFGLSAAMFMASEGRPLCRPGDAEFGRTTQRSSLQKRDYLISALLPAGSNALRIAEAKLDLGYQNLKWKVGVEPLAKELVTARSLLESLPDGARLRLDANGALDADGLDRWLELLAEFPTQVDYLEQPLPVGEESTMAEAMQRSGVPIALDESLNGADGARFFAPGAWSGPLVVKAPLMGDVARLSERLIPVASQVVLSSVFETGIGLENALALADALPAMSRPVGFDTPDAFEDPLNHLCAAAIIRAEARSAYDPETIWNSI